ncbi:FtsX-like permease family protein [Fulvivirga sp. M361]|uniref:ABC transporter permease n=1 Tax=Fulvivirga sp. M361 TaxID=2594266 RepID=UPI00117AA475|nr:ABC transporter permease [Fulvivirga sp. M361]TRX50011.1 FtsX-like permease family protein [Fulvivirga sp. M361]
MKKEDCTPPAWADALLEWYCSPDLLEDLQGDLYERYHQHVQDYGPFRAAILYIWGVLRFIRPYTIRRRSTHSKSKANPFFLIPSYCKTAYRSLKRQQLNTLINILGLSLGLYSFILICLFVNDESKYDRYLSNADRIYRITFSYTSLSSAEHSAWVGPEVGEALKANYPEIEAHVALVNEKVTVKNGKHSFREEYFYYSTPSFFDVFPYEFRSDSRAQSFLPGSVMLTEKTAKKYFQKSDPTGQSLEIENKLYKVAGVLKDIPTHTDLKFDALVLIKPENLKSISWWTFNYVLFKEKTSPQHFQPKLNATYQQVSAPEFEELGIEGRYHMEALPDVHFGEKKLYDTPKSSRLNLYIFSTVALLVLLTAAINYINTSLGSAAKRQNEVGVRKSVGAQNGQLKTQFLFESFIICLSSLLIAIVLAIYSLPHLNLLTQKSIPWYEVTSPSMLTFLLGVTLAISLISGSYPAFYLSSVKPADILKGKMLLPGKTLLRKTLVVVQFSISIALIISTLLIFRQMELIQRTSHGYIKDQVIAIDIPRERTLNTTLHSFKHQVETYPFVKSASMVGFNSWPTADRAVEVYEVNSNQKWQLKPLNEIYVDQDYFDVLGLSLSDGRTFETREVREAEPVVIVNRALSESLAWKDPLLQVVNDEDGYEYQVIGVLEDFHFNSVHGKVEPMLIFPGLDYPEKLMISLEADDIIQTVEHIEQLWKESIPEQPFVFEFLDQYFQQQYSHENRLKQVFLFFMLMAISIACLGLFGLMALIMNQKLKEVSIRKVFGADKKQLLVALSKDYILLILIAIGIASPLTAWIMDRWLDGFAYKTALSWDVFMLTGALVLTMAMITMSYHVLKASFTNPSSILKHE